MFYTKLGGSMATTRFSPTPLMRTMLAACMAATGLLGLGTGSASASDRVPWVSTPFWDGEFKPAIMDDCSGNGSPMLMPRCEYKVVDQDPWRWGPKHRISSLAENCNNVSPEPYDVTRMYSEMSSMTITNSEAVSVKLGVHLGEVIEAGVEAKVEASVAHTTSKTETLMENAQVTVPPGYKGWIEFQPKMVRTYGYMEAEYPEPGVFGKEIWHYPSEGSRDVVIDSPVTIEKIWEGQTVTVPDGTMTPVVVPCGNVSIQSQDSKKCLDLDQGEPLYGTIQIYTCTGQVNQKWIATDYGQLQHVATGYCLAYTDARPHTYGYNEPSNGQKLGLRSCDHDPEDPKSREFLEATTLWRTFAQDAFDQTAGIKLQAGRTWYSNDQCLDVYGGFTADKTPVIEYGCRPDAANQRWKMVR
jgi:ricin-type beta-trefoil lectin protein